MLGRRLGVTIAGRPAPDMDKDNPAAPRRGDKNDQTQMLEEADILEARATSAPPIDAGWAEEPPPPVAQPERPRPPRPPPAAEPRPPAADLWSREAEAVAASLPTRAALLLSFQARTAGDPAAAEAALARATSLAPDARFVAMTRRWLAEQSGDRAEMFEAARAEIPLAGDAPERVPLLWLLAGIADAAGQPEAAERAFREVVGLDPLDLGAHLALAAVTTERQNPRAAAESWELAATRTEDLVARAAFFVAAANLREIALGDQPGARLAYERASEADPQAAAPQAALESLHLRAGAWTDHARSLVLEAEQVGEIDPGLAYHERAGDIFWECLGDGVAAARCYERAAVLAPDVVPLGKLAALYEQEGRHGELVRVYEELVTRLDDPLRKAGVLLRLGTLYESRLSRPDDALRCYQGALEAAPTLAAAAQALAAHYQAHRRWADLAALLLVEADRLTDPAQRAGRYVAIAQLCEVHRDAIDDVAVLYERALAVDPGQAAAIDALDRIYRAGRRWDSLIGLYEQQLAHARSPRRIRALRLALASLYQEHAGAPDKAAMQLRLALGATSDDFAILSALARALADAGQWPEHVEVLLAQTRMLDDDADLVATLYRTATVIETRLDDPARALTAFQQVLERAPHHELALGAILRLQRSQSRWEDLIATERRLLESTERPEEAAAILYRIGQVSEEHLARPGDAITAYLEALSRMPSYRLARVGLERLQRARGSFAELAELLVQQAAAAAETTDRARLLTQAATLSELHLPDAQDRAASLHQEALALVPELATALWGLVRIRERSGDWAGVAAALQSLAAAASEPASRARVLVRLARVIELRLGDAPRAAQLYEQAMGLHAGPAACFDRLRLALTATGDSVGWLELAAAASSDPRLASGLLRLRATAIEHGGGGADDAVDAYSSALRHASDPQTLEGLARNLARSGRDPRLPAILSARARLLRDGPSRALLLAVAGSLFESSQRPAEADKVYGEALEAMPDFPPALDGRRRLRQEAGDWAEAAQSAAALAGQMRHPANRAAMFEEAAALCLDRLGDLTAAVDHYRSVLAAEPGNQRALARTLDLLEQTGEWSDAVSVLSQQIDSVSDDGARAELLTRRAHIVAERLGDASAAIGDVERAARLRPGTPGLLQLLADLNDAAGHWADAARAYQQLADAAPDAGTRRDALLAQARIWTERVPDYARAQRILEEAVTLDPGDRAVLSALAEVSRHAGDHRSAAEVYQRLARSGTPTQRAVSFLALADLRRQLGDSAASDLAAASAFDLIAEDPELASFLAREYRDDLEAYAAQAEGALRRAGRATTSGHLALRLTLAELYAGPLSAPERGLEQLRAAVESNPKALGARLALARALPDPKEAIAELRAVLDRDPTEPAAYTGLARACASLGWEGAAALMASAAALLGADELAGEYRITLSAPPRPVAGALPPDLALELLVGTSRAAGVREVVSRLDPFLHLIFPEGQELRESLSPLPEQHPIASLAQRFAPALDVSDLEVYRGDKGDPLLLLSEPRALALGHDYSGDEGQARARFDIASALARLAGGSALGVALDAEQVQDLLRVVTDDGANEPGERELRKRVASAMPRRLRKELERAAEDTGLIDSRGWAAWEEEERARGRRAGLVFSRDLLAAARSIAPDLLATADSGERRKKAAATGALLDALRFAASDACWELLQRVHGNK
jgi:tetratricopeptide (TPR) repeat protein